MRICLIGTGKIFRTFLDIYNSSKYQIVAICDNDESKYESKVAGYNIISVKDIKNIKYDYICITCNAYDLIEKQLIDMGVEKDKILDFSYLKDYEISTLDKTCRDIICEKYRYIDRKLWSEISKIKRMQDFNMILSARILVSGYKGRNIEQLSDVEFRVFSQNGEDGIIQWIVQNAKIENKIFVEFGVENYEESNTRFLLMNDNWSGLVMDGSQQNVDAIVNWSEYWRYNLTAKSCFITRENINEMISEAGIKGKIGLLSVDIDGNDYWVLDAITCIDPVILICEYNSIWGGEKKVTTPYETNFQRTNKHYSNLYYGASLMSFVYWSEIRGYFFLGCNTAGNNAFFVKKDSFDYALLHKSPFFIMTTARESRDEHGKLTFLPLDRRLNLIKEMNVYDLNTNREISISDLYRI